MWWLIFLSTPFFELYLLTKFAIAFGFLNLVIQISLTAFIGFMIMQVAKFSLVENIKSLVLKKSLAKGQIADDLLLGLSASLLMLPGIISDVLGILLLIPALRKLCADFLAKKFKPNEQEHIIEGEFHEIPNEKLP